MALFDNERVKRAQITHKSTQPVVNKYFLRTCSAADRITADRQHLDFRLTPIPCMSVEIKGSYELKLIVAAALPACFGVSKLAAFLYEPETNLDLLLH